MSAISACDPDYSRKVSPRYVKAEAGLQAAAARFSTDVALRAKRSGWKRPMVALGVPVVYARKKRPVTMPDAISCHVSRNMGGSVLKFEERLPATRGEDSWPAGKTPVTRFQLLRHRQGHVI